MPNTTQIGDILFKKWLGLGDTQSGRAFFSEPILGRPFVVGSQIWGQADQIPTTAPGASAGVVQVLTNYPLVRVAGVVNSYSGVLLKDTIPFNWDSAGSYNYTVKDDAGNSIPFGSGDWTVDTEAGILMFNVTGASNLPVNPTMSFWRYSGQKNFTGIFVSTGATGQFTGMFYPMGSNPSGYLTSATLPGGGGVTQIFVTGTSVSGNITLAAQGNVSIFTGTPNTIIVSGITGNLVFQGMTGQFVDSSKTGQFITTAQTGQFAPSGMTGQFITTAQTGQYAPAGLTGQFVTTAMTGTLAPSGMTGQFVTTNKTGQFLTQNYAAPVTLGASLTVQNGVITTGVSAPDGTPLIISTPTHTVASSINYNLFISGGTLKYGGTPTQAGSVTIIAGNGGLTNDLPGSIMIGGQQDTVGNYGPVAISGQTYFNFRPLVNNSGVLLVGELQTGQFVSSAQTGQFITTAMTGQYAPAGLTGQFVTTAMTGTLAPSGMTGQFITTAQTGLLPNAFPLRNTTGQLLDSSDTILWAPYSNTVWTTGVQTIGGTKTFSSMIVVSQTEVISGLSHTLSDNAWGWTVPAGSVFGADNLGTNGDQRWAVSTTGMLLAIPSGSAPVYELTTLDWGRGYLRIPDTGSNFPITLSWFTRELSGSWNAQSLTISGQTVVIGNQTGQFVDSSKTGNFVTNGMTGTLASAGLTGQFVTTSMTGTLVPAGLTGNAFYPRYGNPASYLTSVTPFGVTSVTVSGITVSGALTFTGINGEAVLLSGQTVVFSGVNTGGLVSTAQTGQFVTTGQIIKFSLSLPSGSDTVAVNYPLTLPNKPTSIVCEMENNVDIFLYSHALTGVSNTGFWVCFSDNLSASGYSLYTTLMV